MMIRLIILFLVLNVFLSGCEYNPFEQNKYQIIKNKDGKMYRFNKKTGEMMMIENDKAVPLDNIESTMAEKSEDLVLSEPVDWGEWVIPHKGLKMQLRTNWRNNSLYYQFKVFPYYLLAKMFKKSEKDYQYNLIWYGFIIKFLDKNGFIIKEIPVKLWDMERIVNKDGEEIALSLNSNDLCTKEDYFSIETYEIVWSLDDIFIPNIIEKEDSLLSK